MIATNCAVFRSIESAQADFVAVRPPGTVSTARRSAPNHALR